VQVWLRFVLVLDRHLASLCVLLEYNEWQSAPNLNAALEFSRKEKRCKQFSCKSSARKYDRKNKQNEYRAIIKYLYAARQDFRVIGLVVDFLVVAGQQAVIYLIYVYLLDLNFHVGLV